MDIKELGQELKELHDIACDTDSGVATSLYVCRKRIGDIKIAVFKLEKNRSESFEKLTDWLSDMALKDNGKVFDNSTNPKEIANITYQDLRDLAKD